MISNDMSRQYISHHAPFFNIHQPYAFSRPKHSSSDIHFYSYSDRNREIFPLFYITCLVSAFRPSCLHYIACMY
uniref:Uncharacterized protein n=1 Tax=Arundo donax TaxID=35708 RepID=A0A0A9CK32_ARUDO